ncbi:MAG: hypothetical protein QM759_00225 [Terricaulis sp.]
MEVKLEGLRGEPVFTTDASVADNPPEVMLWNGRVFRHLRTDGVWDKKKHVYREAAVHDLGVAPDAALDETDEANAAAPVQDKKPRADRQLNAVLNAAQAALLKRVRARGAFTSNKAAVLAGLDALDEKLTLSNDALLKLLAERLEIRP